VRGITDRDGHLLVVMTHNTDFGDAFEREGDSREYPVLSPAKLRLRHRRVAVCDDALNGRPTGFRASALGVSRFAGSGQV
jgi:hypothetical protein